MATKIFQPTLPARGATTGAKKAVADALISTHAPRTGSDLFARLEHLKDVISTHAPRTGSDPCRTRTAPAQCYFNPRSPHGERRDCG